MDDKKYPVLIGSFAVSVYYPYEHRDIDLITDDFELSEVLPSKYPHHHFDIITLQPNDMSAFRLIYNFCNKNIASMKIVTVVEDVQAICCPLILLYSLKKSHIHRILPYTKDQQTNIDLWHKQVSMYNFLRKKCAVNYRKLDKIIYGQDTYICPSTKLNLADISREVFYTGFDSVNDRIGDTPITMTESKDVFFKDGVERFYDHDKIHVLVAQMNRGISTPIYLRYAKNNSVGLSKKKFFNDELAGHIEMFREEIMVLFLERKLLPTIINCYAKAGITYTQYCNPKNLEKFYCDIRELVAVYATNLCGNGQSWLRTYVIDHLDFLMDYDLNKLEKVAENIIDQLDIKCTMSIGNKNSFVSTENCLCDYMHSRNNHILENNFAEKRSENLLIYHTQDSIQKDAYFPFNYSHNLMHYRQLFNENFEHTIVDVFNGCWYYLFNKKINLCMLYDSQTDSWKIFKFTAEYNSGSINIDGVYRSVEIDQSDVLFDNQIDNEKCAGSNFEVDFEVKRTNIYYFSVGSYNYCGMEPEFSKKKYGLHGSNRILSHYGTLPNFIHLFVEHYVRLYLEIIKDINKYSLDDYVCDKNESENEDENPTIYLDYDSDENN